ncbi:hypothetical protein NQZ68_018113 [Dissostichus eleginoides]|nr:hypothetical protein NQZ68_018113 [Dissostichus eleginoides]
MHFSFHPTDDLSLCELHVGLGVIMKVLRRRGGGERRGQMEELQVQQEETVQERKSSDTL